MATEQSQMAELNLEMGKTQESASAPAGLNENASDSSRGASTAGVPIAARHEPRGLATLHAVSCGRWQRCRHTLLPLQKVPVKVVLS